MKLKNILWSIFLTIGLLIPLSLGYAQSSEYENLKTQAEKFYTQGSFSRARKLYVKTNALRLAPKEKRWVDFRLADTLWRAQAGTKTPDPSNFEKARQQLEILIRDINRVEDRDRVWVEIQESLGDFWWQRSTSKNWSAGWKHYQQALEWWAGAKDIERARARYLKIVWTSASPAWREPHYYYGYYGNRLPLKILENALKISQSKKNRTRAHYLIAMTLRNQGGIYRQDRVVEEFQAVISAGKRFEWYDDALFQYAEWLSNYGDVVLLENGQRQRQNNYPEALKIYRRLLKEFSKGETRHHDTAKQRIKNITQPVLGISVANIFLPESEIQFHLNWRNIENVSHSIYPVDLTRDLEFDDTKGVGQWVQEINLPLKEKVLSGAHPTEDKGDYRPGQKTVRLENKLPKGAYVIEVTGGGKHARELILVTDSSLILKSSGTQALVYFCDALDGSPLAKARVTLWERYYTGRKWVWKDHSAKTNKQGMAVFSLKDSKNNGNLFANAKAGDRQAFSLGYSQKYYSNQGQWKLYVFTDRPAYRPNETAHWKVIARNYDGSAYSIPAGETIEFKITDPRGAKLKEETLKLNEFGSAWGSFDLTESNPLGAYQVTFKDKDKKKTIGHATLFRLEEYKLPEFKVSVKTPSENGKQKTFRLGEEKVRVEQPGSAKIVVAVKARNYSDAMLKTFIVHEHGIEKFIARSGKMRGDEISVRLTLPRERKKNTTRMEVQVAPSIAVTMLDSLPYLIDFPYGCTEQTMSRFLPAIVTLKTLTDLGLKPEAIAGRIFGGIEASRTEKTHPKGKKDLGTLDRMVQKGLKRLYDFQHSDGGWGWWKKGESDHFMSAYVLWGLTLAKNSGTFVNADVLEHAFKFLDRELVEEESRFDQQAWMLHALASAHVALKIPKVSKFQSKALKNLWNNRTKLNAYTQSLLAMAAHHYGENEKAKILIENLEDGVKLDQTPDTSIVQRGEQKSGQGVLSTAHWGEDGIYGRWSDGGVEATAFALRALILVDPKNKLIEPVTNWLVKNRRGAHWSNTRNTAISVLALNDYLQTSGELKSDLEYEIFVNGHSIANTKVENVLAAPSIYPVDPKFIKDEANEFKIVRKQGKGSLYFSMQAKFFSLEEPVTPVGNEIFLRRQYYKRVGRPTLLKGQVYDRVPLNDGDSVVSGERIETLITLEAKNNYEYLIIEDLKPAGFESVKIKSGESLYARELKSSARSRKLGKPKKALSGISTPGSASDYTGRTRWVYQELRDRKMAMFIDKLPQGIWEISATLRAEVPGKFHALPVMGHAMYIPEIRANGQEIRLTVKDRE